MSLDLRNLQAENARLREQLAESEGVLQAIRRGEIDAVVITGPDEDRVFTLQGADHPYRVLVESMSEGAATLGRDGDILYANPKLAALLETSRTALIGTRLSDWATEADEPILARTIKSCTSDAVSEELTLVPSGGGVLPVRVSVNTLTVEEDHYCCAVITDQRMAKHQAALEEASQRVREANERLRDADRRKDAFLATLAHELRNPLAPIRTAAYVLRNLKSKDASQTQAAQIIERQVAHMTRLVDDLLEVSRITLGRLKLQQKPEDLTEILSAVIEGVRSSADIRQQFDVELPEEPLRICGDNVRLAQAIANVVENAFKYTPSGGRIQVRAGRESAHGVISIRDTGIGISPEWADQIFEMFTQEDRPDKYPNAGLGIGLALTRSIIELHGGTIEASSPGFGEGSEFVIRLPLEDGRSDQPVDEEEMPTQPERREVLIVDDNVDAAESLRMMLEFSGHDARAAFSGSEALAVLDDFRPDLILLDIGLPDIDGYEVARRLRHRFGTSCPKLVALSGWGREEDKVRAKEVGIDVYLTKPISTETLTRLVGEN
jgi:PAS domain S-box-containing protein